MQLRSSVACRAICHEPGDAAWNADNEVRKDHTVQGTDFIIEKNHIWSFFF